MKMVHVDTLITEWKEPTSKHDKHGELVTSERIAVVVPLAQDAVRTAAVAKWLLDKELRGLPNEASPNDPIELKNLISVRNKLNKILKNEIKVNILSEKEIDAPQVR